MPAPKGINANAEEINRLVAKSGLLIKQIVDPRRSKTLDRARKGQRISYESMHYLAQVFNVDIAEISAEKDQPQSYQRFTSMKFIRTETLKGFPKDFFEVTDIEDLNFLNPIEIEAKFELDDPTEEQSEIAAQLVESVEAITSPQKPSAMIRAKGKLNSTIKRLTEMGVYLYVGSHKCRQGALPFIDADQSEIALPVIINRLLLVFTESRKSRAIQRKVDLGMSLAGLKEDEEWLNDILKKSASNELDEESVRFLDKLRADAKQVFVDLKI